MHTPTLADIREALNQEERTRFSPLACLSREAVRRREEIRRDHRQEFARDCDRILHSRAYTRYIDKTQVFSLVENDHISHRVLHVQMVSRIGRTIARFLGLNEDLAEAIALGHDIGHPPFGHEGERILDRLCREHGLEGFAHNIQSVQFLDCFERRGEGWNLSLQVLDGILCHDGEAHSVRLCPQRDRDFADFDAELAARARDPLHALVPMTLEGCVVRLADTIAYIGRDVEDAIELGLIARHDLPTACRKRLGETNGSIVYSLVSDLLATSIKARRGTRGSGEDGIGFSGEIAGLLLELKQFNYEYIYHNPAFKPDFRLIRECYRVLFDHYLTVIAGGDGVKRKELGVLSTMQETYFHTHPPAAVVRDYLAGMTDDYFLARARALGCTIPERTCLPA